MPRTRTHNFGPGSLESLTLTTWVSKKGTSSSGRPNLLFKARLEGRYTVFCGNGWEHDVDVKEERSGWLHDFDSTGKQIAYAHEEGVTLDFVSDTIEWALEDWEDPCDLEDEL